MSSEFRCKFGSGSSLRVSTQSAHALIVVSDGPDCAKALGRATFAASPRQLRELAEILVLTAENLETRQNLETFAEVSE